MRRSLSTVDPEQVELAVILADEMVTNAVKHGAPPVELWVEQDEEGIMAAVTDSGEGVPVVTAPDSSAERGRGMWIIDQLSDSWGVQEVSSGKRIWSRVDVHPK